MHHFKFSETMTDQFLGKIAEYSSYFNFENFDTPALPMTWGVQNRKSFDWDSSALRDMVF
jgi:hypothetical protein